MKISENWYEDLKDSLSLTLHDFCDASQDAYGACVYIQSTTTCQAQQYVSKSRIAPLKQTIIPQLELCGILLLAELVSTVVKELASLGINVNSKGINLWTDSIIMLSWINCTKPLQKYVANRVAWIHDHTKSNQ